MAELLWGDAPDLVKSYVIANNVESRFHIVKSGDGQSADTYFIDDKGEPNLVAKYAYGDPAALTFISFDDVALNLTTGPQAVMVQIMTYIGTQTDFPYGEYFYTGTARTIDQVKLVFTYDEDGVFVTFNAVAQSHEMPKLDGLKASLNNEYKITSTAVFEQGDDVVLSDLLTRRDANTVSFISQSTSGLEIEIAFGYMARVGELRWMQSAPAVQGDWLVFGVDGDGVRQLLTIPPFPIGQITDQWFPLRDQLDRSFSGIVLVGVSGETDPSVWLTGIDVTTMGTPELDVSA